LIFLKNLDKIDYNRLSKNKNVEIIDLLKEKVEFKKIVIYYYKIVNILKKE
tara:strand:- start:871 stop:1023 length:153 start_codon:yes stop_codon:yes gene_type:complete